jgi:hypothetical protein
MITQENIKLSNLLEKIRAFKISSNSGGSYLNKAVENIQEAIKENLSLMEIESKQKEIINTTEEIQEDSCWGFFGSDEETLKDMFNQADLKFEDFEEI